MSLSSLVLRPLSVLKYKRGCVLNLNEEYTGQHIVQYTVDLHALNNYKVIHDSQSIKHDSLIRDEASNGWDNMDDPPDSHLATSLMD